MRLMLPLLALLLAIASILSLQFGSFPLTPIDAFSALMGHGSPEHDLVLFGIRLPRLAVAIASGMGFALAGCILQAVSRNILADPGILGLNSGAGLMVLLQLYILQEGLDAPDASRSLMASLGAGLAALSVYLLARKNGRVEPARLLLCGIALNAGLAAAMLVISMRLDRNLYDAAVIWLSGSLSGKGWSDAAAMLPWLVILGVAAFANRKALDLLGLGDEAATSVGLAVDFRRLLLLAIAVGLAGASVAAVGGVGFIGLLGPNMARRLVGVRHGTLLPASALAGALLMVVGDTAARTLLSPVELPTGVMVAIIGAPYFLLLMMRTTR